MMMIFDHDRLRRARLDAAMTQDEAADALGIAARTYRRYESGQVNHPTLGFRVRHSQRQNLVLTMCAEFELTEDELVVAGALEVPSARTPEVRERIVVPRSLSEAAIAEIVMQAWSRCPSAELTFISVAC